MLETIQQLLNEVEAFKADNLQQVEEFRIKLLGKKGSITQLFAEFKNVPVEQKKEIGQKINVLKDVVQDKISSIMS